MNIFCSIAEQKLVKALTSKSEVTGYTFVLRDSLPISLYLVQAQSNIITPYAVTAITSGHHVEFGAKAALTDATYLVEQATWTPAGSGSTQRYEASFPMDGATLIAAMAGLTSLDLHAEFTTQDEAGKQYNSTQFALRIIPDVMTGGEA